MITGRRRGCRGILVLVLGLGEGPGPLHRAGVAGHEGLEVLGEVVVLLLRLLLGGLGGLPLGHGLQPHLDVSLGRRDGARIAVCCGGGALALLRLFALGPGPVLVVVEVLEVGPEVELLCRGLLLQRMKERKRFEKKP